MTTYQFFRIVEIRTKIVSVSSFAIGTAFAIHRPVEVDPVVAALFFVAMLCVDMGTTAFNSFFDYMKGVDSHDFNREGDKVLIHEGVAPGIALLISFGLFAAAAAIGIIIGIRTSGWIVVVGAASMAVGFLYNAGPLPISRTPLGELFAGVFLGGVVVVLSYVIHAEALSWEAVLVSLPSTLFIASILTTNNTCDVKGDRAAGRRTLAILLGACRSRWLIYAEGLGAYLVAAILILRDTLPPTAWLAVGAGVPLSIPMYLQMHRRGYSHATKGPSMQSVIRAFVAFTLLLTGALIAEAVLFV